jgi:hypothetical protein
VPDARTVINFLWAAASLAHRHAALLPAALQLLLQRSLLPAPVPASHLALAMWSLAALLVVGHLQPPPQEQPSRVRQLVRTVRAVQDAQAQHAAQLWHGRQQQQAHKHAFSGDSRRQMHQARVWLQAVVLPRDGSAAEAPTRMQPQQAGLWSADQLLQAAEQQLAGSQQQQQQQQGPEQQQELLPEFWRHCAEAWQRQPQTVSRLQREVAEVRVRCSKSSQPPAALERPPTRCCHSRCC